jgi:hypothetical protein
MCGMTDEERLDRIAELRSQLDTVRRDLFAAIRAAFPENRGEPPVRGRLAEVSKRADWSREYVASIRDGKVTAD